MKISHSVRSIILAGSLLLQLCLLCFRVHGAAGDVDLSFDPGSGVNGPVNAVAVQPDGKVLIAGIFTTVKGLTRTNLARLNADGSGDSSFTAWAFGLPYGIPLGVLALQPDGKVLVSHYCGISRLNSDGSSDASFNASNLLDPWGDCGSVYSIAVQSDGKVLVGGDFLTVNGTNWNYGLARLDTNGSLDINFNVGAGIFGTVYSVALQSNGKVLVGEQWNTSGGTNKGLVRLNANGSLDNSFNPGIVASDFVYAVAVQSDDKVLIGGDFTTGNGTNRHRIARLDPNGSLDGSFLDGSSYRTTYGGLVTLQPDGKVLLSGRTRLNSDGSLDGGFNPGAGATNWGVSSAALQPDGKLLLSGYFNSGNGTNPKRVIRLNSDGSLEGSFDPGSGLDSVSLVGSLVVQPDGKVVVGSVRLNADGSLDGTYTYIQPTNSNNFPADTSFPDSDYSNPTCSAVLPDGKRLIGGYFASSIDLGDGSLTRWTQYFLMRFNADASRDTNFVQVIGPPDYDESDAWWPMSVALQPDGKALFNPRRSLQRFNPNGAPDASFNPVPGSVFSFKVQGDGKIFIAGSFVFVNAQRGIARLNVNGSLDTSFNSGTGASQSVGVFVFQPDGKVLIGGEFTTVNGTNRNHIARLNANGSLDLGFNPGTGADGNVASIALQPDGNILISGDFLTVSGVLRPYVARLYGDSPWPSLNIAWSNASVIVSWPVSDLNFQLHETTNLSLPNSWSLVPQSAVTNAGTISTTISTTVERKFFRLKSQ